MPVIKTQRTASKLKVKNLTDFESSFDGQGSYTGVNAEDIYEKPVQDADDL